MIRLNFIDSLRGWAILGVIMVHTVSACYYAAPSNFFILLATKGYIGVWLFFIVSAFTIFLTLDKKRNLPQKNLIKGFYLKRFLRIAPMYYIAILYYTVMSFLNSGKPPLLDIFTNLFFIHGFFPDIYNRFIPGGWSIAVEMTFYAFIPLIYSCIKNLNQAILFLVFSFIIRGIAIITAQNILALDKTYSSLFFPAQLPIFALGIILYYIVIKKESHEQLNYRTYLLLSILPITFLIFPEKIYLEDYMIASFFFFCIAIFMSRKKIFLLDNHFIQWIGKISYSLYIVHFIVLFWLEKLGWNIIYNKSPTINFILFFVVTFLFSSAISQVTYIFVEKPFQSIKIKL